MHSVLRGLRSGVSLFRTSPGAAIAAVVALGLGIGSSTTMFSIVRGGTRALPVDDPASIVAIQARPTTAGVFPTTSLGDYRVWSRTSQSFETLGAFQLESRNVASEGDPPERVSTAAITSTTFDLLRVMPVQGRVFVAADARHGSEATAVISHALWSRRYGADPTVIGRTLRLDGVPHTVIGVMPPGFAFPINAAIWTTLAADDLARDSMTVQIFGRLADGIGNDAARAELMTIARDSASAVGRSRALDVIPFTEIETPREVRLGLYLLLLAATGVLFIACVNVASLFIARAVSRARDVAVRLALGAERRQLLVEHIAESLVFSGLAAVCGLAIAAEGTGAFRAATSHILEAFWVDFRIDLAVVLYASALGLAAAAAAAVVPALRASRTDVIATLRDGGLGASSLRIGKLTRGLLSGQIAAASALLALTLLLGQAAVALHTLVWPFNPDAVLTAQIGVPFSTMDDELARRRLLVRLEAELGSLPGARAALTSALPGRGSGRWSFSLDQPMDPSAARSTAVTMVSARYFDVVGATARRGRSLLPGDSPEAPDVAVVNESFVTRHSRDRDPIGRRIFIGTREFTIVGVVADAMPNDIDERQQDGVYVSLHQMRPFAVRVVATGPGDPHALARPLRAAVDRVDAELPIFEIFTARVAAMREKQVLDVISGLFSIFGAGALLLTAIGLYSVTAFAIAQRRREFGIRIALGATRRDLVQLLSKQSGRQVAIGLGCGVLLAIALIRGFTAAVEFTSAGDGLVIGGVLASLLVTIVLAMTGPVVQACRTDPARVLRS